LTEYAEEHDIAYDSFEDLIINEDIIDLIDAEVAEKNKDFASFESIKKVTIVPEFTIENGLITPTFKVKKNVVQARFKDEIDAMYPEE